jgi:RHS repeat-associated protein
MDYSAVPETADSPDQTVLVFPLVERIFCVRRINSKRRRPVSFCNGSDSLFHKFVSMILAWALVMGSMPAYGRGVDVAAEARSSVDTKASLRTPGAVPFQETANTFELPGPSSIRPLKKRSAVTPGPMQLASLGAPAHGANMTAVFDSGIPGSSSIASNFNATAIHAGNFIWFSSVLKASGLGSAPVRIFLRSASVRFAVNGITRTLPVPDATVIFSPSCTSATTTFDTQKKEWITSAPSFHLEGNTFLSGLTLPVSEGGLPGGINPVTLSGTFYVDTAGVSLNWQWAAAVYTVFSTEYQSIGVKPVDSSTASVYKNSDHAGTPENYKNFVTGGARGGGGANYTGSYSATASIVPVVQVPNYPPVAKAGPDQTVHVGDTVQLDGTASTDQDGDPLTYRWSFNSIPAGSVAILHEAHSSRPSFSVDRPGTYVVQLIVNDGKVDSTPATVTINTVNSRPVANAGPDQSVLVGANVHLSGSGSTDVDGDPLTYRWSLTSVPPGSAAQLSSTSTVDPRFTADVKGTYVAQLIVNDGHLDSTPDSVTISTQNSRPIANPGPIQTAQAGQTVILDGSKSSDVDGDPLTFRWSILSKPDGSNATLSDPSAASPRFVADRIGSFVIQLIVNDGALDSVPATVAITTQNTAPVANAGPNQSVFVGTVVQLDGSRSSDVDGNPLTYRWSLLSVPLNSAAQLSDAALVNPTFAADTKGTYIAQLVVNDGFVDSAPATVTISTLNSAPVANAGPAQTVLAGATVQLNGSGSTDVDGDPLTFRWSITSKPSASNAVLSDPASVTPTFTADELGTYVVQLIVNDGNLDSVPTTVTIDTSDSAPVANAGPAQTVPLGALVALNGGASSDADGQPLVFRWSLLSVPQGSGAALSDSNAVQPTFTADLAGSYVAQLIVNDGFLDSAPSTVVISTLNSVPVANAGVGQSVSTGTTVQLDGSGSRDADFDPLTFRWSILVRPAGSSAVLSDPTAVQPTFVADVAGTYVAQLIVNDSKVDSAPATVMIVATNPNQPPIVNAGPSQTITLPTNVATLNGSVTDDGLPAGTLNIQWSEISGPATVTFASPAASITSATFPVTGTYVLRLSASDTELSSFADVSVVVNPAPQNQPPQVNAGTNRTVLLGTTFTLQGTVVDDGLPNGNLTTQWSQLSGPSTLVFTNAAQPATTVLLDKLGTYILRLTANDGEFTVSSDVTFVVVPSNGQGNQAPVVSAGPDQVITFPGAAALDGSVIDDGLPSGTLQIFWSKVSGPGNVTFADSTAPKTSATFSLPGEYVLRLNAGDSQLFSSSDVKIIVSQLDGTRSSKGTEFWLMFPEAFNPGTGFFGSEFPPRPFLYINSEIDTNGTVAIPGINFSQNFTIAAHQLITMPLPFPDAFTLGSEIISRTGIHITADHPITVYGVTYEHQETDAFLALPVSVLGTEYINASYSNNGLVPGSELGVVAAYDNTTVTITPSVNTVGRAAGQPFTVVLHRGRTYQLRNTDVDFHSTHIGDLTGTIITSDKPIAVYGAHLCPNIPGNISACNHTVEQLTPTNTWGTQFATMPLVFRTKGDPFRIIAATDNTNFSINGVPTATLGRGEFYEVTLTQPSYITSNQPVMLVQYEFGTSLDGIQGDPTMIVIPPLDQFRASYTISTVQVEPNWFQLNFANVIVPVAAIPSLQLDGVPVNPTIFRPVPGSGFSGAQIALTPGVHQLVASSPFGAFIYGLAPADAYGYPAGIALGGAPGATLTVTPATAIRTVGTQACVVAGITDANNNPLGAINVTFSVAGANSQTGHIETDANGQARFCYSGNAAGMDSVTTSIQTANASTSVDWQTSPANQPPDVSVAPVLFVNLSSGARLIGTIADDGLPVGTLTSQWSQISGPGTATFVAPASTVTTASFSAAGDYLLRLTALDSDLSNSADVIVHVNDDSLNTAPVILPMPGQTVDFTPEPSGIITIAPTVTDDGLPLGSKLSFNWILVSGDATRISLLNPTSQALQIKATDSGVEQTFTLRLVVDDSRLTSTVDVTVKTVPANRAPVVDPGPALTTALPNATVTLNGKVTDDGKPLGGTLTVHWQLEGGPGPVQFSNSDSAITTASFSAPGTYSLKLTANDGELLGFNTTTITVKPANAAPIISFIPNQTITLPTDTVTFAVNITDDGLPAGVPLKITWTQFAGPGPVTISSPGNNVTQVQVPQLPGVYRLQLTVDDSQYQSVANAFIIVNPANQPPVVNAGPNQTAVLPNAAITLSGTVTDDRLPSGAPLTQQWTVVSGPGTVTFSAPTQPVTSATFTVAGTYLLRLTATDTQFTVSSDVTVTIFDPGQNLPPTVFAGLPQSITLPTNSVTFAASVKDDGKPTGAAVSVVWSLVSGPAPVVFANPNSAFTKVTFSVAGIYVLRITANDTQLSSSSDVTVVVNPQPNAPPFVGGLGNGFFNLKLPNTSITINGIVSDDGLPNGTLNIQWIQADGPGLAVFSAPKNPVTQITVPPSPGRYTFLLTASDGQYKTNATAILDVGANNPPSVGIQASALTIRLPQNTVTLVGQATDDGVPGGPLTYKWAQVTGPAPAVLSAPTSATTQTVFTDPGAYIFHLMVSDGQLTSIRAVQITVLPPLPPAPTVSIISPNDGDEITHLTDIIGSATSDTFWFLEYALVTSEDDNALVWNGLAAQNAGLFGPYVNTKLGSLDPSLLLNGTYKIRLRTTDNEGQSATFAITVTINKNLKVGQLALSFNDLTIPAAGLPIQVIRSYDSRDHRQGDFGFGWSLGLENIRLQKNRSLGKGWDEDVTQAGFFPVYCLKTVGDHIVTITFPDGKVYKFRAIAAPECQQFSPIQFPQIAFQELTSGPGTQGATLQIVNQADLLLDGAIPGPQDLIDTNTAIYNPTVFKLITAEGFSYVIDQNFGATSVTDPNGNTLTISNTGVSSSTGASAVFVRDAKNHITQITDARGNLLKYVYDSFGHLISFTDAANTTTTFSYDQNTHLLTGITDARGVQVLRNIYDPGLRLVQTNDANGIGTQYQHDIPGQRETILDRLGNKTILEYDADGNVTKTTDALGNVTTRTYDENDNKLSETNALGKTTNFSYDASGNKLSETDPLGHITNYSYSGRNQILSITDALGHTTGNSYDSSGSLLSMKDSLGNTTAYSYNSQGLPVTVKDAAGHTTGLGYDGNGRISSQTDALGNVTDFTYDAAGNRLSQSVVRTRADGTTETLTTQYQYDGDNRLVKTTNPDGSTTRIVYNAIGKQSDTFDELNRQTHFDYDSNGRLIKTTYPDGTFESSTYDANDRRITSTDRAGRVTSYTYDALGRLTKTTYPDLSTTQTAYDAIGQVIKKTDALGHATTFAYDDAGRRISSTDALGHVTTFAYDAAGDQVSVTDPLNHTIQYVYDNLNRRVQTIYPDQTTESLAYDAMGRQISKTDQAGKVAQYGYDALRRLTSVTQFLSGAPVTTTYAYDEVGNRLRQTDANGHITSFAYDQLGRRTSRKLPLGMTENYGYDAAGNLISKQDFNGHTTTYQYDSVNRLTKKTADVFFAQNLIGVPQLIFTYNATGKRLSMTDASGVTNYTYDTRDRLLTKATPFGTLTYTYDATGNAASLKSSNTGGASLTYTYDALNRLSTVADASGITTYNYDAAGNLSSYAYPNGVLTGYGYDPLNRLTNMQSVCATGTGCTTPGASISSYAYTLDSAGNRLSVTELSGRKAQYGYDDLYHLTSETISGAASQNGVVSYKYDAVGNRTKIDSTLPAIPASGLLNYDANDRTATDAFDNNGNTINNGIQSVYDFEDHLVQRGGVSIVYDGDGNRVSETVAGVTTSYLVADENLTGYAQVLDELQGGSVTRAYSYGLGLINERQAIAGSPATSFYGYDGHGSVRFLTNSAGTFTDTYDYDAFGNLIASTGTTPNNYLFAGEQFDPALGLYYSRARYLDVRDGRFMTMDPELGNTQDPVSLHRYLYANADPVNAMDPSGQYTEAELSYTMDFASSVEAIRDAQVGSLVKGFVPAALKCIFCKINPGYRLQDAALDYLEIGADESAQEAYKAGQDMLVEGYNDLAKAIVIKDFRDTFVDWGLDRISNKVHMELVLTLNVTSNSGYRRGTQGSAIFVSDVDAALNPAGEKLKKLWHLYKALEATKEFIKEANNPDTKDGLACKALQIAALAAEATEPLIELFK